MSSKEKAANLGQGSGKDDSGTAMLSVFNFSTTLSGLQAQAESRMKSDPDRYGDHFLIWLSLHTLKNGLPWPGGE